MKQSRWATLGMWAAVMALAGCASTGQGGTEAIVQVQVDKVQHVTRIDFPPQPLECERRAHCPMLGVSWSSATPNRAVLLVGTWGGQAQVQGLEFNVRPHAPLRVRSLAKQGSDVPGVTAFVVPMDTLERVALSKGGFVKLYTNDGVIEEQIASGESSSRAADALKRFVYEAYKDTDKALAPGLLGVFNDPSYAPNYDK